METQPADGDSSYPHVTEIIVDKQGSDHDTFIDDLRAVTLEGLALTVRNKYFSQEQADDVYREWFDEEPDTRA